MYVLSSSCVAFSQNWKQFLLTILRHQSLLPYLYLWRWPATGPRKVILSPGFDHERLFKTMWLCQYSLVIISGFGMRSELQPVFFLAKNNLINFFTWDSRLAYSLALILFVFSRFSLIESDYILMIVSCLLFNIYLGLFLYTRIKF